MRLGTTDDKAIEIGTIAPPEMLRGVKALIVDDNLTNRRILLGMLGRWEMKPTAVDGADGFTLIERIRQRPELSVATIMMLTSAGHRGDAARCRELLAPCQLPMYFCKNVGA